MSVPFTERKPSQCVYLIDHMVCCGRPVHHKGYCADHHVACRRPWPLRLKASSPRPPNVADDATVSGGFCWKST